MRQNIEQYEVPPLVFLCDTSAVTDFIAESTASTCNSIKTGFIQKLQYLMQRLDSNFTGIALSRGPVCAASKPLLITIPTMHAPSFHAQQYSKAGI